MPQKSFTVTRGGVASTIGVNRDIVAGVTTFSKIANQLENTTTSIQVTVAGHSDLDGVYTGSGADTQWTQQGGNGRIATQGYNSENGDQMWFIYDTNDFDPNGESNGLFSWSPAHVSQFPWLDLPSSHNVTITSVPETISVNRTAPVITSDRKGGSRPLLSKLVGGAAAAYSLRDLNDKQGNNKVVRVRRASDNNERDFLAKEVSNGTLKNWVNTQTVLPLDIQALTDDGRTGSVIAAKAAYSLRNLSKNYTGNVVDVRRSSDDTTQGFTAAQVTDGTLLDFVSKPQVGWNIQPTFNDTPDGTATITSASSTATTSTVSFTGSGTLRALPKSKYVAAQAGDQVVFNMSVSGLDSAMTFRIRKESSNTTVGSATVNNGDNQNVTLNLTASSGYTGGYPHFTADAGSGEATVTINSVTVTGKTGFVSKWYDQSGENNHAVQETPAEQPKIVNAGSVMLNEDGHPAIGFQRLSGGSTYFDLTTGIDIANSHSFQYVEFQKTYTYTLVENTGGGNNRIGYLTGSQLRLYRGGSLNFGAGISVTNNPFIYTTFLAADGSASKVNVNGDEVLNQVLGNGTGGTTFNAIFRGDNSGLDSQFTKLSELIVYDTDQTDNRTAIEANIGEAYSITSIPAYDNTVDGFVEAWYDQSGNGKDAVQAVSTEQPKIVNAGSLVDGGLLFEDGQHIDTTDTFTFASGTSVSAFVVNKATSTENAYLLRLSAYIIWKVGNNRRMQVGFAAPAGVISYNQELWSPIINVNSSGGTGNFFVDGTLASTANTDIGTGVVTNKALNIGGSSADSHWNGTINEIILYTSDQTANRPAIDANIKNQYEIS